MSETLIPYTEFDPNVLGMRLHELVMENQAHLETRHLLGVIHRYATQKEESEESAVARAAASVTKGQGEDNPQHYAVVDAAGDVQGSASIFEGLPLGRLRTPVPAGLARGHTLAYTKYPFASHNVHAWTAGGRGPLLKRAYSELLDNFRSHVPKVPFPIWDKHRRPWTIEPMASPQYVHAAIAEAGLTKIIAGRFDDAESGRRVPLRSVLYTGGASHLYSSTDSERAKLRVFKTGQKTLGRLVDDDMDEIASRNPIGY